MGFKEITKERMGGDTRGIEPEKIVVEPGYNIRQDLGDLSFLKSSIRARGFDTAEPLVVEVINEVAYLRRGHRRLAAVKELIFEGVKIELVPVVNQRRGTSDEQKVLEQITGNDGLPLTALDEAEGYYRLRGFNLKMSDIAAKVGRSPAHISNHIDLLSLPTAIRSAIIKGKVSVAQVQAIATKLAAGKMTPEEAAPALQEAMASAVPTTTTGKPRKARGTSGKPKVLTFKAIMRLHEEAGKQREANDAGGEFGTIIEEYWRGYQDALAAVIGEKPEEPKSEVV